MTSLDKTGAAADPRKGVRGTASAGGVPSALLLPALIRLAFLVLPLVALLIGAPDGACPTC